MILAEFIFVHGVEDRNVDAATAGHGNSVHLVTSISFNFVWKPFSSISSYTFELGLRYVSHFNNIIQKCNLKKIDNIKK